MAPIYAPQTNRISDFFTESPPHQGIGPECPITLILGSMRILPVCVWAMGSPFGEILFGLRIVLLLRTLSFLHISLVKGLSPRLWGNPYVARALGFCFRP